MKISSAWLHEFLPVHKSPEQLDQLLTDTGLEVEGFETIESVKGGLEGVVVAEVIECEQHPNADRLRVCMVDTGDGGAPVQVDLFDSVSHTTLMVAFAGPLRGLAPVLDRVSGFLNEPPA